MFACPKCKKVYKKNGKWILRHMVEVCHCKALQPIEFCERFEFAEIKQFIIKEISKRLNQANYGIAPIERLKQDNHRPERNGFKVDFAEVVKELKGIFENGIGNYLKPIIPRTTIELPPTGVM